MKMMTIVTALQSNSRNYCTPLCRQNYQLILRNNIFTCLFGVHNTIGLSRQLILLIYHFWSVSISIIAFDSQVHI